MTSNDINMLESLKFFEEKQKTYNNYGCCMRCKYYQHEDIDDGYVCVNDRSDFCADWVEPTHSCDEFTEV